MIACTLEVHKRDVPLQVARDIIAAHQGIHLGVNCHLVEHVTLVKQGAQVQAIGLDMTVEPAGAIMLRQGTVKVGIAQGCSHAAVKGRIGRGAVHFPVNTHVATTGDDVTCLWRQARNEAGQLR